MNERLSNTMDHFETNCINPLLSKIDQNLCIQISYHLLVFILVYSGLTSTPEGIIQILGLGGLNLTSNFKNAKKAWWNYSIVKLELKEPVSLTRAMLLKAGDDEELLKEVERHIDALFAEIRDHHILTSRLRSLEY